MTGYVARVVTVAAANFAVSQRTLADLRRLAQESVDAARELAES